MCHRGGAGDLDGVANIRATVISSTGEVLAGIGYKTLHLKTSDIQFLLLHLYNVLVSNSESSKIRRLSFITMWFCE